MMAVYVAVAGVGAAGIGYVLYRCYDAYYGSGAQTSVGAGSSGWSDTENVWKKGALAIDSTAAGLERDVCGVWERSWTTLPVCVDLPRLARKMTLMRTTASGGSEVVVDGPAYDVSSDHAKHTLMHDIVCELARMTDSYDESVSSMYWEQFGEPGDDAVKLKHVFTAIEGTRTDAAASDAALDWAPVRILKACNQSLIAPAVLRLKTGIAHRFPFKDKRGAWTILVEECDDEIVVTHCKSEMGWEAPDKHDEEHFDFRWELCVRFDRHATELRHLSLKVVGIEFVDTVPQRIRDEALAVIGDSECIQLDLRSE